jgi:cytochrome c2
MPNFWPGAVDAKAVPHSIDAQGRAVPKGLSDDEVLASHRALREEEVSAIVAYLWTSSQPAPLQKYAGGGNAAHGKELVDAVGCRACHVLEKGSTARRSEASNERDYAPNLYNVGDKASPEWVYSWLKNPKSMWPQTKMPDLRLTDGEAADITAYLMTLKTGQKYPDASEYAPSADKQKLARLADLGKQHIAKYGCFGCHDIKGFENAQKIGTELSEHGRKDPNLLDFGDVHYFTEDPKHHETYANWVFIKLGTPRIYAYERVETRMPQFDFSEDERIALLTFLKGQTGEKPADQYLTAKDPQKAAVYAGEKLVYWNGCRNCHVVEKRGGAIRDRFNEDDQSYAPPILTGEGWKVQPEWLFSFLKEPMGEAADGKNLRPWIKVRMPTFHFTDADATDLVRYFAAASNKSFPYLTAKTPPPSPERMHEANALFTELKCLSCHVVGELRPGQDPGSAAPNLLLAKRRLRPDWIPAWLTNPQALMDGTKMPSFWDFSDPKKPTAPSKAFNGDAREQIDALRDLLMHLSEEKPAPRAEAATPRRRRGG